jgi:hypothetical protein
MPGAERRGVPSRCLGLRRRRCRPAGLGCWSSRRPRNRRKCSHRSRPGSRKGRGHRTGHWHRKGRGHRTGHGRRKGRDHRSGHRSRKGRDPRSGHGSRKGFDLGRVHGHTLFRRPVRADLWRGRVVEDAAAISTGESNGAHNEYDRPISRNTERHDLLRGCPIQGNNKTKKR